MRSKRQLMFSAALVLAALTGISAGDRGKQKQVRYVGIHPIAKAAGGGLCHIEFPHVHVYGPTDMVQYRDHDDAHYFVGDPVAYGWEGDKHSYYGHHPIYVDAVVDGGAPGEPVYCYINGPHYHAFEPPLTVSADFRLAGNAYFYVGTPPPTYVEARPQLAKINAVYTPIEYARPVVTVEPPSAWIGITFPVAVVAPAAVVVEEPHGHVHADVVVPGAVVVDVRPPSIEVGIGVHVGGGFIVGGHDHGHGKHKYKYKGKGGKRRGNWR